jgi:FkbM family methyltransferase
MSYLLQPTKTIVTLGALLPSSIKSYVSYRFFSAIARRISTVENIVTNMGISSKCSYKFPSSYHLALFGKPSLYMGERGALDLCAYLGQRSDAFVDIGANIGYFTFLMREKLENHKPIYFFEPDPDLFNLILHNVNSNSLVNITGFKSAISSTIGKTEFYKNISDYLSGSLTDIFHAKHDTQTITVDVTTFSNFSKSVSLENACVKVDVEGAEYDFIKGAINSLDSIAYLVMEVLKPACDKGFVNHMIELGFTAYYINDYCLEHSADGTFDYVAPQYNWLFCHESPSQLRNSLGKTPFEIKTR